MSFALGSLLLAVLTAAAEPPKAVAIVGASVVHPASGAVDRDATVVVQGGRITAAGHGAKVPAGAKTIDGRGKWVIPGLIDSHVHFFQSGNLFTRPDAADFNAAVPYAKENARNRAAVPRTLRAWLAAGVTGVADMGGPFWNFELREQARRTADSPRVAAAGPLISMVDRKHLDLGDPPIIPIPVDKPDDARALAKRELAHKPDFVKVWFIHRKGDDLAKQEAIVRAAAEEAHAAGVRLAVHATELQVAKSALRAGADVLVHSVFDAPVDAEFLALAKERRAIYVPTLFVMMGYRIALSGQWKPTAEEKACADPEIVAQLDLQKVPRSTWPDRVRKMVDEKADVKPNPVHLQNLKAVHEAGIEIAMGTDAGNIGTVHGPSIFRELQLMAQAGLKPLDVLRSATVAGAHVLGADDLGDVAAGKAADLVVLDADPLASVDNLSRMTHVIRAGRVYERGELCKTR